MTLTMQQWIFHESYGRYSIDLGDSNVAACAIGDLPGLDDLTAMPLGYGHEAGLPELRAAIAATYTSVAPENVLVSHGGQEAFSLLVRALDTHSRNQVLVLGSGWAQHSRFPAELGLEVHTVPLTGTDAEILTASAEAVNWHTRAIVVASPDNPTCWTASQPLVQALAEIADVYDALLIVDEEYVVNPSGSAAGLADSVAVTSGLSKIHGLPGLRIGWCVASPDVVRRCAAGKHLTTIANSVLCESIALAVLRQNDRYLLRASRLCRDGLAYLREWAARLDAVRIAGSSPELPFAWLALEGGRDSLTVAREALADGVLVVPGEVFGRPGHLRIAVGRPVPELAEGLRVVGTAIEAQRDEVINPL